MDNLTAGNPLAHAVRVYYEGDEIIYQGMPVCYNFNTTKNWFGGSVSDAGVVSANNTTAEGSQNEGKYIRVTSPISLSKTSLDCTAGVITGSGTDFDDVEVGMFIDITGSNLTNGTYEVTAVSRYADTDADSTITLDMSAAEDEDGTADTVVLNNLLHFAGVVKKGGWCGKTGPRVLDIYVPNGAVVPVRCDVDTTVGITILSIASGQKELGISGSASTSRPVALAMETETDLDSVAANITLAKLDPNMFLYQTHGGTALSLGAGTAYGKVNITTATTSLCWGPQFKLTNAGSTGAGGMVGFRIEAHSAGTAIAGNVYGLWSQAEVDASGALEAGAIVAGVWAKSYINVAAGDTAGAYVVGAQISLGLEKASMAATSAMLWFDETTLVGEHPDYFFIANTAQACVFGHDGGTATGSTCANFIKVAIKSGTSLTAYYIPMYTAAELGS